MRAKVFQSGSAFFNSIRMINLPETLDQVKQYRPGKLVTGTRWYVEYYVFDPANRKLARKRIRLDHIEKISDRRAFANGLIRRLNVELEKGWNPFIHEENSRSYALLTKAQEEFMNLNRKKHKEKTIRDSTINSYESFSKKLTEYLEKHKYTDMYVYGWNKDFIVKYLDYVYDTLNKSSRTRDNYLKFLRLFSSYMVDRGYIKVSPAEAIQVLGKGKRAPKNRTVLPANVMALVSEYLEKHNMHFYLAAQILYFCMVRPREMTFLKIKHINLEEGTIFIEGKTAKNYHDAVVTIPKALNELFVKMKIMENPAEHYLFSQDFKPGKIQIREKQFSHYWARHVRKDLGLPLSLKFYSLKDTGITDMIRTYNDPLLAKEQARHSDLAITALYTPADSMKANVRIKESQQKFAIIEESAQEV